MTDLSTLERLAQAATPRGTSLDETPMMPYTKADIAYGSADHRFIVACSPDVILALIETLRKFEKEFEERGYAFQDAQNKTLLENQRLVARVQALETVVEASKHFTQL